MDSFTTANAAFAASALIRSCGRNTVPASNPFPTSSRAGIMSVLMSSSASVSFRASLAASDAAWDIPFMILFFNAEPVSAAPAPDAVPEPAALPVPAVPLTPAAWFTAAAFKISFCLFFSASFGP